MKITDFTTIYAAIIATFGLIWNFIQWYKQHGRLKVSAAICRDLEGAYTEEVEPKQWGDLLRIDIVNSGKADITLTEIGLKTGRPKPWCLWQRRPQARLPPSANQLVLPHTLAPTKTAYCLLESAPLLNLRTVKNFFVKDSHGKEWHASGSQVKFMRKIITLEKQNRKASALP